ncbi:MAG: DUF4912 domain-containing protein [Nitrospirota bacterium]
MIKKKKKNVGHISLERLLQNRLLDRERGEEVIEKEEGSELPSGYGETKLTILEVDPCLVYTYWEITRHSLEQVRVLLGKEYVTARFILRFYDVTYINFDGNNAHNYFDIYIEPHTGNWYIKLWSPAKSYLAEIGLLTQKGRFYSLARSNPIHTPQTSSSNRLNEEWMRVNKNLNEIEYLSEDIAAKKTEKKLTKKYENNKHKDKEIKPVRNRDFSIIQENREIDINNEETSYKDKVIRSGITIQTSTISPQSGISSEIVSSQFPLQEGKNQFFCTLNTEIILYGTTKPKSKISISGKSVDVREDGTFSIRLAIPDGVCVIPVEARTPDGKEKREITTTIVKDSRNIL